MAFHRTALREAFDFQIYAPGDGRELLAWRLPIALATTNVPAVAAALMGEFRRGPSRRSFRVGRRR